MLRLGTYGLLIDGPIGHAWYKFLDRVVYPDKPQSTAAVLIKTAADQLIWAPIMTVVFFALLKTLEGHPELILSTVQVSGCLTAHSFANLSSAFRNGCHADYTHQCVVSAGQACEDCGGKLYPLACSSFHQLPLCAKSAPHPVQQLCLGKLDPFELLPYPDLSMASCACKLVLVGT